MLFKNSKKLLPTFARSQKLHKQIFIYIICQFVYSAAYFGVYATISLAKGDFVPIV